MLLKTANYNIIHMVNVTTRPPSFIIGVKFERVDIHFQRMKLSIDGPLAKECGRNLGIRTGVIYHDIQGLEVDLFFGVGKGNSNRRHSPQS